MKQVFHFMVMALWLVSCNVLAATEEETLLDKATQLNKTAENYYKQGNYSQALKVFQASLRIREKVLGKQHSDTATSYNNIGETYRTIGDYIKASKYQFKALTIREKVLGKQHPHTATSYNNIGVIYSATGNHTKALEYKLKALVTWKKTLGKQHPAIATNHSNIGVTYRAIGDYNKALEYYLKALTIQEKVLGKQHPDTALSYNNIGVTYNDMGNHTKALKYKLKALTIWEKVLGKQHPDTALSYNNIGETYSAMEDHTKALEYKVKALTIEEKVFGKQHPATAKSYNNIGVTYGDMGNYTKALKYKRQALAIWEKVLGKKHPDTATSYSNIGATYYAIGNYNKALKYQIKALSIDEKVLGKLHPATAKSYNNIGGTYAVMGNIPNAYQYAKKAFAIFLQQRDNNFTVLDSTQKKQYLTANENWIDFLLYYAHHYQQTLRANKNTKQAIQLAQTTVNDWLAYKGSILDSENRLVQLAKGSKDATMQQKYQKLVQLKQTYSKLNQNYPKVEQRDVWQQQLKQQQEKIAILERQITQSDPRFKVEKALQTITSKTIADGLSKKELYIDYGKVKDHYFLFTIDHKNNISFNEFNKKDTKAIDQQLALFNNDIEEIINEDEIPEDLQKKSKDNLSQLYQLLIPHDLAAKIATKDSLIISPDGGLRLLPFEALYNQDTKKYLIQQKDIRYIASGKELVRLFRQQKESKAEKNDKAVLFANPDFDKDGVKKSQKPTAIYTRNTARGRLRSGAFAPLKGTQTEAEDIIDILQKTNVRHYYSQGNATEANLLTIKQPNILHIATHGFFDADTLNPMLQSGLVFAGANVSIKKGTGEGIVTALDLSGLDLKGTDLVVLSACETGKVDPNNTAGVSGLTKAFIQAGAKDVVMSLWQVADKETADLMKSFYQASKDNKGYSIPSPKPKVINL